MTWLINAFCLGRGYTNSRTRIGLHEYYSISTPNKSVLKDLNTNTKKIITTQHRVCLSSFIVNSTNESKELEGAKE